MLVKKIAKYQPTFAVCVKQDIYLMCSDVSTSDGPDEQVVSSSVSSSFFLSQPTVDMASNISQNPLLSLL